MGLAGGRAVPESDTLHTELGNFKQASNRCSPAKPDQSLAAAMTEDSFKGHF